MNTHSSEVNVGSSSNSLDDIDHGNNNLASFNNLHPLVDQILPLPSVNRLTPSPLLFQEIERYEQEQDDDTSHFLPDSRGQFIKDGIDLNRYKHTDIPNDSFNLPNDQQQINPNEHDDNLYTSLSYSILQDRNLSLIRQNNSQFDLLQNQHLNELSQLEDDYRNELHTKRQRIDEVNVIRKKRQVVDFKPVNDYLNDRWKDGIKSVVDLGIESTRMDMDMNLLSK